MNSPVEKTEPVAWQYRFRPRNASAYYWTSWAQGRRPVADESEEHVEFQERALYSASTVEALKAENAALREELACTLEEIVAHMGDDMNDTLTSRIAELRAALQETKP